MVLSIIFFLSFRLIAINGYIFEAVRAERDDEQAISVGFGEALLKDLPIRPGIKKCREMQLHSASIIARSIRKHIWNIALLHDAQRQGEKPLCPKCIFCNDFITSVNSFSTA